MFLLSVCASYVQPSQEREQSFTPYIYYIYMYDDIAHSLTYYIIAIDYRL